MDDLYGIAIGFSVVCFFAYYFLVVVPREQLEKEREQQQEEREDAEWEQLVRKWLANPDERNVQNEVAEFVRRHPDFVDAAYALSLKVLERDNNSANATVFALETGRFKCSLQRKGPPTLYDEQAIQNDIDVRTK